MVFTFERAWVFFWLSNFGKSPRARSTQGLLSWAAGHPTQRPRGLYWPLRAPDFGICESGPSLESSASAWHWWSGQLLLHRAATIRIHYQDWVPWKFALHWANCSMLLSSWWVALCTRLVNLRPYQNLTAPPTIAPASLPDHFIAPVVAFSPCAVSIVASAR